jgi:hypothetical protein
VGVLVSVGTLVGCWVGVLDARGVGGGISTSVAGRWVAVSDVLVIALADVGGGAEAVGEAVATAASDPSVAAGGRVAMVGTPVCSPTLPPDRNARTPAKR